MKTARPGTPFLVFCLLFVGISTVRAEDEGSTDLLRLPIASIEEASVTGVERNSLTALVDKDPTTVAVASADEKLPLAIVYGFGGETVALEKIAITLPETSTEVALPAQVDLLVSTLSPHSGFQSVRADRLEASTAAQEFSFLPIAAKWVMFRFTPSPEQTKVAVADIAVTGHVGPPVTHYQFKESPAKAFDVLQQLEKNSAIKVALLQDEIDLFEDANDGKLNSWSIDEAALLASGVTDEAKRNEYLKKLDKIESEAKHATDALSNSFEKGQALLKFLHAGPMSKGYVAKQTDLAAILDSGTFNCVSSATLFNVVGRRLGLDCRGIEVPEHAFAILYDGIAHADVETTTESGFNPSRDEAAQKEFSELTGFNYIPDSNRDQRREVGDVGLIAITYYNHGVVLSEEKRYPEALMAYFRAMSLDPESDSAVKNALAVLANWSLELANEQHFEEALNVLATGLDLAPEDATLVNNHKAVWGEWAESLMKAGKDDEAIALLQRAAREVPDGDFIQREAWVFIRKGEEFIKSGDWREAMALVGPGLERIDEEARGELQEWGGNLIHRWAQTEEKLGHFDKALEVLESDLKEHPDDEELINHLAYIVQEWARTTNTDQGPKEAEELVAKLLDQFGKYEDVREVAQSYAHRVVKELAEKKQYEEALATADRIAGTLKNPELALELSRSVYDEEANALMERADWQAAIDLYAKSLERFPADEHLLNNQKATWSRWAQSFLDKQDWDGALNVYNNQRKLQSDADSAETNIRYCIQEWTQTVYAKDGDAAAEEVLAKQLVRFADVEDVGQVAEGYFQRVVQDLAEQAKYDEALDIAVRSGEILRDKDKSAELAGSVYDRWANVSTEKKEWQSAIDVYTKGLERFPKNAHLEQNAAATWYRWAKVFMDDEDWAGAIKIYEQGLEQFPDNSVLQNNLEYCRKTLEESP